MRSGPGARKTLDQSNDCRRVFQQPVFQIVPALLLFVDVVSF
jgi:hypothetical protein